MLDLSHALVEPFIQESFSRPVCRGGRIIVFFAVLVSLTLILFPNILGNKQQLLLMKELAIRMAWQRMLPARGQRFVETISANPALPWDGLSLLVPRVETQGYVKRDKIYDSSPSPVDMLRRTAFYMRNRGNKGRDVSMKSKPKSYLELYVEQLLQGNRRDAVVERPDGASGKSRYGVVWLHGLGDFANEAGWNGIIKEQLMNSTFNGPCSFVFLQAPICPVAYYLYMPMPSWLDMKTLGFGSAYDPPSHGCSLDQAKASAARVAQAIDKLRDEEGIPPERIAVGGFSQGGAVAIHTALTYSHRLAACLVFSGFMFGQDKLASTVSQGLPVFWAHGSNDDVLEPSLLDEGAKALQAVGANVTAKVYPMGHEWQKQEMQDAAAFLSGIFA